MKKQKSLIYTIIFVTLSIVFTFLIKAVNVQQIGPNATEVGFANWNLSIHQSLGFNELWYKITQVLGYAMFAFVIGYAILGLIQLIKRKSLKKVDKNLLYFGGMIIVMLAIYIIFDKLALNYRPVIIDGELEPSYPSSHTLFALCIAGGVILVNRDKFATSKFAKIITIAAMFLATFTIVGRMLSGAHWITDILGGILISAALVSIYNLVLDRSDKNTHGN